MQVKFFFWGGSLFRPRLIQYSNPFAFTILLFASARTGAHLSSLWHCLQGRPTCSPQRENPTLRYSCRWRHFSPSDANFVFSDIRGSHSGPVIWAGFHRQVILPSTFCHSVGEMAAHYSLKRDNMFGEFSFSLRPVYGRFFYPGCPSCGRAGPGVEPGIFGLKSKALPLGHSGR